MTYIVTTPCIDCKYSDCAAVCPVEVFHETPDRLLINPDTCIDCDACIPECPVEAIFSDMSNPPEYEEWIEKNAEADNYPIISVKKPALYKESCTGPPDNPEPRCGLGLAIVPRSSVIKEKRNEQFAAVEMAEKDWVRPVGAIYRSNRTLSVTAKKFLQLLRCDCVE